MNKLLNITLLLILVITVRVNAQEEAPELLLNVSYHAEPSGLQYLKVNTRTKENNKLVNVAGVKVKVYLDSIDAMNMIGETTTSPQGEGSMYIPAKFKEQWKQASNHIFKAVSEPIGKMAEATAELNIVQGKIEIDTLFEDDVRSVKVRVMKLDGTEWFPASDVEVAIGIMRYGGELPVGDEESYTTDSLGETIAEFKRDSVPADSARNLVLVARITDNESFGNMYAKKTVPWGIETTSIQNNNRRTLWATRDRAPIWLLLMAYLIIATVWGTILYLVYLLIKIIRNRRITHADPVVHVADVESVLI